MRSVPLPARHFEPTLGNRDITHNDLSHNTGLRHALELARC